MARSRSLHVYGEQTEQDKWRVYVLKSREADDKLSTVTVKPQCGHGYVEQSCSARRD